MSGRKTILILLPLLISLSGCVSGQLSSSKNKTHYEDLTQHRLQFPAVEDSSLKLQDEPEIILLPPDHAITGQVNTILDSIARFNKGRLFIDGYTIQIYSGLKREEAMNSIKRMKDEIPDLTPDLAYQQPKFRVKTGSYFTRLEAQRDLRRLKQIFPTAILVPEKVALK